MPCASTPEVLVALSEAAAIDGRQGALPTRPRYGQRLLLTIDGLADDGAGVARLRVGNPPSTSSWRVEVRHALPGEQVEVVVGSAGRGRAEARALRWLSRAADRVEPACRHAGPYDGAGRGCGGCALQHLAPAALAAAKVERLRALLAAAGLDAAAVALGPPVEPAFGMRTKMEFSFADDASRAPALGLHPAGYQHEVVAIERCDHLPPRAMALLAAAAAWQRRRGVPRYDGRSGQGWLRTLSLRVSARTGFCAVELGTSEAATVALRPAARALDADALAVDACASAAALAGELCALLLALAAPAGVAEQAVADAFYWTQTAVQRGAPTRSETAVLHGPPAVHQRLCFDDRPPLDLWLHPRAFFQPHAAGAEAIAAAVRTIVRACQPRAVLDLYCGAGMLGLAVADLCSALVGVELVAEAAASAADNARRAGVDHARYLAGDAGRALRDHGLDAAATFDLVIVDPPRAGLSSAALSCVLALGAPVVIYVSCNPASLARDAAALGSAGWRLEQALALDPFPATMHLETVAWFRRATPAPPPEALLPCA